MSDRSDDEYRDPEERRISQFAHLREIMVDALDRAPGLRAHLGAVDPRAVTDGTALAALPVLRKADLVALQAESPPFGGLTTRPAAEFDHAFMSPGPIFEPGSRAPDWWRLGRFLRSLDIGADDVVQNCFGYHLTPAGMMFESAARAVGATVIPAGTGQSELQVAAAAALGATAYAGTPDYLKVLLQKAEDSGTPLSFTRAAVSGGALFPALRAAYADRGITCRQCYATADLGLIAYETQALDGMVVDEGVIVEIVRPGTGDPVPDGEVGEVVVTALNPDYPLIRFATGDLSAVLPGTSPCGRTNMRIRGWMGRADQTTKIKGMFVRPEQVAELARRVPGAGRIRVEADRDNDADVLRVKVEGGPDLADAITPLLPDVLKLKGEVVICPPGSLPNDGKVIDDLRSYD